MWISCGYLIRAAVILEEQLDPSTCVYHLVWIMWIEMTELKYDDLLCGLPCVDRSIQSPSILNQRNNDKLIQ